MVAHFAGEVRPADEAVLRAHLTACEPCRSRYRRLLVGATLARRALPAEERLARGLGLRRRPQRPLRFVLPALATAAAALALWALPARPGPTARGAGGRAQLWVYRVETPAAARLAGDQIAAGDELAFAYANPAGRAHLLVFGVDEHRHVYWYHPAWPAGAAAPAPVAAAAGVGPHELPEAIRHPLDGRHLEIDAVLSARPLSVEETERAVAAGALESLAAGAGGTITKRTFTVAP